MAIDAHSTTAPTDHRALLRAHGAPSRVLGKNGILSQLAKEIPDLPPSFIGAVPVPTPDLTAETIALLDVIPPDVRHGGAGFPLLPNSGEQFSLDAAQALHMRRALEGALDHGTAPLPSLPEAFTRRRALFGAVVLAAAPVASLPAVAAAATPSPADARLLALADAYEALERRCHEHTAAHRHLRGRAFEIAEAKFDAIVERFLPIEEEVTATPADSLAGVLAKARMCQVPTARQCAQVDHVLSVADDLHRLFGGRHG